MKQSKEFSLKFFSNRAKLLLSEALVNHLSTDASKDMNENNDQSWIWNFELRTEDDKVLTLSYENHSGNQLHLLFLECLTRIASEKTILFLVKVNFREIENYLRDENHLLAFPVEDFKVYEAEFKIIHNSLLISLLIRKLNTELNLDMASLFKNWVHLSLVVKNSQALLFVNALNKILLTNNSLQLIMAENAALTIILNDFPMDISILQGVVDEIFRSHNQDSSLKVVAVQ